MKKINIAIDANEANVTNRVGSGQYAHHLFKHWSKNANANFNLFLKSPPLNDLPESSLHWNYRIVRPSRAWLKFSLPFHLLTNNYQHDVFFSPAHYAPPITRSKLVVTIHDLAYELYPELFLKPDLYKLKKWTRASIAKATRVIAVSEATKRDIVNLYDTDPNKVSVVYNGFDRSHFNKETKSNPKILKQYKINNSKYLLYVGTIQPRKNVIRLVQAFHLLKESKSYTGKLVIAGNFGWMSDQSLQVIHDSPHTKDIILTGYVAQDDLPTLYKNADVYVLPSLLEGFGIPLLESMAVGTPVASADNSSLPEVVGKAGELFDPHDPADIANSLKSILRDRKKYIQKGFKQVTKFSWEKSARQTLDILREVALAKS